MKYSKLINQAINLTDALDALDTKRASRLALKAHKRTVRRMKKGQAAWGLA